MSKMKKLKKTTKDVEPEDVAGDEKQLDENDTQEVRQHFSKLVKLLLNNVFF